MIKTRKLKLFFAAGLFISEGNLTVQTREVVGCLISKNGNIKAKRLLYYPYFTRASLNVPRKLGFFENMINLAPDSTVTREIGANHYHILSEGWER
jgi:hypothetical protein